MAHINSELLQDGEISQAEFINFVCIVHSGFDRGLTIWSFVVAYKAAKVIAVGSQPIMTCHDLYNKHTTTMFKSS